MSIYAACPQGHRLKVPSKLAGKTVRCPKCSRTFQIPAEDPAADEIVVVSEEPSVAGDRGIVRLSPASLLLMGAGCLATIVVVGFVWMFIAGREAAAPSAESSSGAEHLQADIREAISMLQEKQYRMFIYDFMPPATGAKLDRLAKQSGARAADALISDEEVIELIAHLEGALTGEMVFNRDNTLAEVTYVRKPVEIVPESFPANAPASDGEFLGGVVSGLGDDLPRMLRKAAELLRSDQFMTFAESVYPHMELDHFMPQ